MQWVEIPACRVLVVTREEILEHFERYNEDGQAPLRGERTYRYVRKADRKVFTAARWCPNDSLEMMTFALEEV